MDHKGEFTLLVQEKLGKEAADSCEWSSPRLLCIAGDFTKYDEHAVQQINRNIELLRYRRYGEDLLLMELVNATTALESYAEGEGSKAGKGTYKTVGEYLDRAPQSLKDLYESLKAYLLALGDDVQVKELKFYIAFKRIQNFACVEVHPSANKIVVFIKVDPDTIAQEEGFSRDVRNVGHYGTGDLELSIRSGADLEKAKPLLMKSYEVS
jgi:predicted transport protein